MIIPKIDPVQFALTEYALPEVKNVIEAISEKKISHLPGSSAVENIPTDKTPEEVMAEMIRITAFEMVKNEIFFPENSEEEETW